jgi:peptidyl-prolyl cis-trans isomerase SurA
MSFFTFRFSSPVLASAMLSTLFVLLLLPAIGRGELVDRVVAVVNNDVITLSEVNEEGRLFFQKITAQVPSYQLNEALKRAREEIINSLIDKKLIAQEAAKQHITVSEEEIDSALKRMKESNRMSEEDFLQEVKKMGMDQQMFRENLRNQILQSKLTRSEIYSKIVVTDEMILDYYDTHYTKHLDKGGYYLLQMGFVWGKDPASGQSAPSMYADKMDAKKRAERVRSLVLNGQDFKELAKKFSDLPSAKDGGDIGAFQENEMADYMKQVVLPLKAGEISEVVETPAGYQFFKLLSNQDGQIVFQEPYETVEPEIRNLIYEKMAKEEFEAWIKKIKDNAYIKRM